MKHITAFNPSELSQILTSLGQPSYRIVQIYQWLYKKGADSFDDMLNLPKNLREELMAFISFSFPKVVKIITSVDGTQKFIFQLADKTMVEAVVIKEKGRLTLCVSTQAGCRQGCLFCVTGKMRFKRSLFFHEISDQVLIASRLLRPKNITNIVIMGMGEPLDNYLQVIKAIRTLTDKDQGGISSKRITLSTAGIVPNIYKLSAENLEVKLAVSVNAPNDKIRNALMPINRRFPLCDLIESLKNYPSSPQDRITIEYCLIRGINDSIDCAFGLVSLLKELKSVIKVNLISYNQNPLLPFRPVSDVILQRFHKCLTQHGILATVRKSKGRDIQAACGQLGYQAYTFNKK